MQNTYPDPAERQTRFDTKTIIGPFTGKEGTQTIYQKGGDTDIEDMQFYRHLKFDRFFIWRGIRFVPMVTLRLCRQLLMKLERYTDVTNVTHTPTHTQEYMEFGPHDGNLRYLLVVRIIPKKVKHSFRSQRKPTLFEKPIQIHVQNKDFIETDEYFYLETNAI
jgi:hypothetical protein